MSLKNVSGRQDLNRGIYSAMSAPGFCFQVMSVKKEKAHRKNDELKKCVGTTGFEPRSILRNDSARILLSSDECQKRKSPSQKR
jgi:hypothetical protein